MDSDLFTRYMDAWNRHDIDTLLQFLTEDATYTDVALNMSSTGKVAIQVFFEHVQSDRDGANLRATGKSFRIRGVSIGELRNGRIARNTDYWRPVELFVQIGLMPEPGSAGAAA